MHPGLNRLRLWVQAAYLLFSLGVFSQAMSGTPTDPCAQMTGAALSQCSSDQQALRQQTLEQQLQQQEQRQNQLDQQQREVQQQLESMRQQNEALRKMLRETASHPGQPAAADHSTSAEKSASLQSWKAENPWFGSNYAKTDFAVRYAKRLQQERPELTGRAFLDELTTKVNEKFR